MMTAARVRKDLLDSVTLTFGSRTEITLIRDRRVINDGVICNNSSRQIVIRPSCS
ncbi:hypothetical protein HMPREF9602_00155 [Cutibacterium acnes HL030PA2]|nr:hypothetical protein HMPREF9602_00155 [Cutibacterium acnes HL030PA2]